MRSIKRRFEIFKEKNVSVGDFICFRKAVGGQGFTGDIINYWFLKLVNIDDYDEDDRKELIDQLTEASNIREDRQNEDKFPLERPQKYEVGGLVIKNKTPLK